MSARFIAIFIAFFVSNFASADIIRLAQVTSKIYRGGQPETQADYDVLKKLGVKTIINLRNDGLYEKEIARTNGFQWEWFPMQAHVVPQDILVDGALSAMNDPAKQPVFIHCRAGKDRTGLIVALHRALYQRWPSNAAYYEMLSFGFNRIWVPLLYVFYKRTAFLDSPVTIPHSPSLLAAPIVAGN